MVCRFCDISRLSLWKRDGYIGDDFFLTSAMADSDTEDSDCESALKRKNSRNNTVKRLSADSGKDMHEF